MNVLEWISQNQAVMTVTLTGVVAAATVVYAVLTVRLVRETMRMRQAETEPSLSMYLQPDELHVNVLHVVVKNAGKGPAYRIKWEYDLQAPLAQLLATKSSNLERIRFLKSVRYMAPGQEFRSFLAVAQEVLTDPPTPALEFAVEYRNRGGDSYREVFLLDPEEFRGVASIRAHSLAGIASSLERIQRDLHGILSGTRRLRVDSYDSRDRESEHEAWLEAFGTDSVETLAPEDDQATSVDSPQCTTQDSI